MKKLLIGVLTLVLVALAGCGGGNGLANNPIEVVDSVEVGMTRAQVEEVVDLDHFKDNKSFRMFLMSKLEIDGEDFNLRYSKDGGVPYYGYLFFSVESKTLKPAVVIFEENDPDTWDDDLVVAVGAIPFDYGQMIVEEETGKPFRR